VNLPLTRTSPETQETGTDRRLIKRYAARIGGGTVKVADDAKTNAVR
jgi:hypothetical protein